MKPRTARALVVIALAAFPLAGCGSADQVEAPPLPPAPSSAPSPPAPAEAPSGPSAAERAEAVTMENQVAYVAGLRAYAKYDYAASGSDNPRFVVREAVRLCDYIAAREGDPVAYVVPRFETDEQRAAKIVEYTEQNFCTLPGVRQG